MDTAGCVEVGGEFDSFDALNEAIENYSKENNVVFVKADCRTVENANRRLSSHSSVPYNIKFKYSYVKFVCKHFGEAKSKSTGKRPNQRTYKTGCEVFIYVTVDRKRDKLVVVQSVLTHSHEASKKLVSHYPERRRVTDEQKEAIQSLSNLSVAPAVIAKHIRKLHGKCLTVKDIQNIRRVEGQQRKQLAIGKASSPSLITNRAKETYRLSRTQKFTKIKKVLMQLGDCCSEVSQEEFDERYNQLLYLRDAWMKGELVSIVVDKCEPNGDANAEDVEEHACTVTTKPVKPRKRKTEIWEQTMIVPAPSKEDVHVEISTSLPN